MAETNTRQASRAPVTLKIKFKSETLDQFIERYSVDISHGGIFIRTKDPLSVGTTLKFEFQLKDATPLIAGEGTVVWTREHDPKRSGVSPGMGVRFDKLPNDSQKVLDQVLAKKDGSTEPPAKATNEPKPAEEDGGGFGDDFVDTPTRVAPAALVDSLNSGSDYDDGDMTPLPKPMPFHGDMDDFSDEAFSESTKVASLDSILAQAQRTEDEDDGDSPYDDDEVFASTSAPTSAAKPEAKKPEKPSVDDYEDPFADLNDEDEDEDSAASNEVAAADTSADADDDDESGAADAVASADEDSEDTQDAGEVADDEVAASDDSSDEEEDDSVSDEDEDEDDPADRAKTAALIKNESDDEVDTQEDEPFDGDESDSDDVPDLPSKAAVVDPDSEQESGSSMPWIAVAAVILLIGGAGGFWLLNKGGDQTAKASENEVAPAAIDASKVDETAIKDPVKDPVPPTIEEPPVVTAAVAITSVPEGATVTVEGTDTTVTTPAILNLPKGEPSTLRFSHETFQSQSIEVVADGSPVPAIKLVALPRLLRFTSTPPGAKVIVNGKMLPGATPLDIPFDSKIARRAKLNIQYRLPRHKLWTASLPTQEGFVAEDEAMVRTIDGNLVAFANRPTPNNSTPKDTAPKDTTPKDTAPKDTTPKDTAPKDTTPKDTAPKDTTPKDTTPKDTAPKDTTPKDTAPKDTTPKDTAPKDTDEPTPDWMK